VQCHLPSSLALLPFLPSILITTVLPFPRFLPPHSPPPPSLPLSFPILPLLSLSLSVSLSLSNSLSLSVFMYISLLPPSSILPRYLLFSLQLYIHRSGRTARANTTGTTVSLVAPEDAHHHNQICSTLSQAGVKEMVSE
jgi:hypothetical protein